MRGLKRCRSQRPRVGESAITYTMDGAAGVVPEHQITRQARREHRNRPAPPSMDVLFSRFGSHRAQSSHHSAVSYGQSKGFSWVLLVEKTTPSSATAFLPHTFPNLHRPTRLSSTEHLHTTTTTTTST